MGSSGNRVPAAVQLLAWLLVCSMALGFLVALRPGVALSDDVTDLVLPTPLPSPSEVVGVVTETVEQAIGPSSSPTASPSPSSSPTSSPPPSPKATPSATPSTLPTPVSSPTLPAPTSDLRRVIEVVPETTDTISTGGEVSDSGSSAQIGRTGFTAIGPRSTTEILALLEGVPSATIARILAPFPVAGPASYGDDWGAPRFNPFFHFHEGTDIFSPRGTPVIAPVDGIVSSVSVASPVGGTSLLVTGRDGTYFYLAHMDRLAAAIFEERPVVAGDVIGFVGTSGNAEGTVPHLHFEIHPNGGPAVPPVPYLDRWLAEALQTAELMSAIGFQTFGSASSAPTLAHPKSWGSAPGFATAAFLGETTSASSKAVSWIVFSIPFALMLLGRHSRRRSAVDDDRFFYL